MEREYESVVQKGRMLRNDGDWVKKSMSYKVEGVRERGKARTTRSQVVESYMRESKKIACAKEKKVEETAVGNRGQNGRETNFVCSFYNINGIFS